MMSNTKIDKLFIGKIKEVKQIKADNKKRLRTIFEGLSNYEKNDYIEFLKQFSNSDNPSERELIGIHILYQENLKLLIQSLES